MVTIQDVARAAGVSPMTVSNVLNGRGQVRASTRERVEAAIDGLGYRVNVAARNLRAGRTGTICLALPHIDMAYTSELAGRVIRAASQRDLRVVVEVTGARTLGELDALALSRVRMYDGTIIHAVGLGADDLERMAVAGAVVVLGERQYGPGVDHIGMPNRAGARAVVEHLLSLGRRRVAVLGARHEPGQDPEASEVSGAGLRIRGYRDALEAAGIDVDPALVVRTPEWSLEDGAAAVRQLADRGAAFDAAFCLTDTVAFGVLRALADAGLTVPRDVAVAGFDDVVEARYSIPRLTTVSPDHEQLASTAVDLLVERIASGAAAGAGRDVTVAYEVVVRESTAGRRRAGGAPSRDGAVSPAGRLAAAERTSAGRG